MAGTPKPPVPPYYPVVPYGQGMPRIILEEKAPSPGTGWVTEYDLMLERSDGLSLRMFFDLELETPDAPLESGRIKRYKEGFRFRAELGWKEFYAERIAWFLSKLHNWLGETGKKRRIRFWPHWNLDLWHEVYEEKGWDYPYFRDRWVGFDGVLILRGEELYDELPYISSHEVKPLGTGRWDVKYWAPVPDAHEDYKLIWQ